MTSLEFFLLCSLERTSQCQPMFSLVLYILVRMLQGFGIDQSENCGHEMSLYLATPITHSNYQQYFFFHEYYYSNGRSAAPLAVAVPVFPAGTYRHCREHPTVCLPSDNVQHDFQRPSLTNRSPTFFFWINHRPRLLAETDRFIWRPTTAESGP